MRRSFEWKCLFSDDTDSYYNDNETVWNQFVLLLQLKRCNKSEIKIKKKYVNRDSRITSSPILQSSFFL